MAGTAHTGHTPPRTSPGRVPHPRGKDDSSTISVVSLLGRVLSLECHTGPAIIFLRGMLCNSPRQEEDTMRRSIVLCMVACLAFSTPIHAQEAPPDQRTPGVLSTMAPRTRAALLLELQARDAPRPESSLVTSAIRAASRLEHQPTTPARSGRRTQRVLGGVALLALSGFAILSAAAAGGDHPDQASSLFLFGIALGVAGGVMIARADSTSPINVRDGGRTVSDDDRLRERNRSTSRGVSR